MNAVCLVNSFFRHVNTGNAADAYGIFRQAFGESVAKRVAFRVVLVPCFFQFYWSLLAERGESHLASAILNAFAPRPIGEVNDAGVFCGRGHSGLYDIFIFFRQAFFINLFPVVVAEFIERGARSRENIQIREIHFNRQL